MRLPLACLIIVISLSAGRASAQDSSIFAFPVQMDEFVLKASREGWDVQAFIRRVQNDTTFYKAFKTLHLVPYTAVNDIRVFGNKGEIQASLFSTTMQNVSKGCRTTKVLVQKTTGDFFDRRGNYNYYTAELYGYLFFTDKPICGENNIVAGAEEEKGKGQLEKRKWQLKQLIFNPGSKVAGVPFAGNKAAIFDEDIGKLYDFKILSVEYDGEDCLLFSAIPKPEHKGDVIYNDLSTWFRKSDYAIVARDYSLSYKTMLYDFDVTMKVRLKNINGQLLPSRISYNGNWHIATQKRERAAFTKTITY